MNEILKQKLILQCKGHKALLLKTHCLASPSSAVCLSPVTAGDTGSAKAVPSEDAQRATPAGDFPTAVCFLGLAVGAAPVAPEDSLWGPALPCFESDLKGWRPLPRISPDALRELGPWVWEARTLRPLRLPLRVFRLGEIMKERRLAKRSRLASRSLNLFRKVSPH